MDFGDYRDLLQVHLTLQSNIPEMGKEHVGQMQHLQISLQRSAKETSPLPCSFPPLVLVQTLVTVQEMHAWQNDSVSLCMLA